MERSNQKDPTTMEKRKAPSSTRTSPEPMASEEEITTAYKYLDYMLQSKEFHSLDSHGRGALPILQFPGCIKSRLNRLAMSEIASETRFFVSKVTISQEMRDTGRKLRGTPLGQHENMFKVAPDMQRDARPRMVHIHQKLNATKDQQAVESIVASIFYTSGSVGKDSIDLIDDIAMSRPNLDARSMSLALTECLRGSVRDQSYVPTLLVFLSALLIGADILMRGSLLTAPATALLTICFLFWSVYKFVRKPDLVDALVLNITPILIAFAASQWFTYTEAMIYLCVVVLLLFFFLRGSDRGLYLSAFGVGFMLRLISLSWIASPEGSIIAFVLSFVSQTILLFATYLVAGCAIPAIPYHLSLCFVRMTYLLNRQFVGIRWHPFRSVRRLMGRYAKLRIPSSVVLWSLIAPGVSLVDTFDLFIWDYTQGPAEADVYLIQLSFALGAVVSFFSALWSAWAGPIRFW